MARHWIDGIDSSVMRGIEFGALHNPRFPADDPNVTFVDHASTADLRVKYKDNADTSPMLDRLVDVDVVWVPEMGPFSEFVGEQAPFDFVYASHVFEHLADPVGWLHQMASVLKVGGIVSLVIPDKRFCFDINRRTTELADIVDAYLAAATRPRPRDIIDFHSKIVAVDTAAIWAGTANYAGVVRPDIDVDHFPMELSRRSVEAGEYIDVHVGVFTPRSLLALLGRLNRLDLLPFRVKGIEPTQPGQLEFQLVLERVDPDLTAQARSEMIAASLSAADTTLVPEVHVGPESGRLVGPSGLTLGPREYRAIMLKRRNVARAQALKSRVLARARRQR